MYKECRELLPELTDSEFNDFLFDVIRYPDVESNNLGRCTAGDFVSIWGNSFSTELYSETKFRVVCEGPESAQEGAFLSEKVYQAIINRVPFIVSGECGLEKKLGDMGFKTYRDQMYYPKYNEFGGDEQFDRICKNVQDWLEYMPEKEINDLVEYNYNHYLTLARNAEKILSALNERFGFGLPNNRYTEMCNTFYFPDGINRNYKISLSPQEMRFAFP